jgi:hypothetical protein
MKKLLPALRNLRTRLVTHSAENGGRRHTHLFQYSRQTDIILTLISLKQYNLQLTGFNNAYAM